MNTQSEQIDQLFTSLAKAQGAMMAAEKDSSNPFFKSKYADLNSVWKACREPLSANGLCVTQTIQHRESGDVLLTILGHSSGQYITSSMNIRIKSDGKTNELQVLGSAISYLRRYSLMAIVGIAPGDEDDGQSATGYQAKAEQPATKQNASTQIEHKKISLHQSVELKAIISACSKEYKQHVGDYLKGNNLRLISDLPEIYYDAMKQGSIAARDEYAAYMAEQKEAAAVELEVAS